jgi:DtxR family Mn-dependent transcriptional regulator
MDGTVGLTSALEDYLETVYRFVRDQKVARVKDIAKARGVRAASVTPAMRRLADLGLVRYVEREYIDLTPEGEGQARRIYARHRLLNDFFERVLSMPGKQAEDNACAMEHSLTNEGMDHLTRFVEFLQVCPEGRLFLERFHQCASVHLAPESCMAGCQLTHKRAGKRAKPGRTLADLKPGEVAVVSQVHGTGAVRQRLLDTGLLPGSSVEVERVAPDGDPIWIRMEGFAISLRRKDASTVSVERKT